MSQLDKTSSEREVNPYIPKFISNLPWYNKEESQDYLSHQRQDPTKPVESHAESKPGSGIVDEVRAPKRASSEPEAGIYKKVRVFPANACTNCGSLNHLAKECLEKPRKVNAKMKKIILVEDKARLKNVSDWDSKRDRWNGYDAEKEWENQTKHWKLKEQALLLKHDTEGQEEDEYDEDEAAELLELGLEPPSKKKEKIINLMEKPDKLPVRSRDDVPVYLQKIGSEVTYNPKTRTDRSLDTGYVDDADQFVRHLNGELEEHKRLQLFAWDLNKDYSIDNTDLKHLDKHLEASPTLALLEMQKKDKEESLLKEQKRLELLARYGEVGATMKLPIKPLTPKIIRREPKADFSDIYNPKLKDQFTNGHTTVWGSYWQEGRWGYKCCKQLDKESKCTK